MTRKENEFRSVICQLSRVVDGFSRLEAKPCNFGCRHTLHCVEIHLIEAIGLAGSTNVTDLAQRLKVTKGAVSQKISRLCKMKLICKHQDEADRRNVSISLTEEGKKAFRGHEEFHREFFQAFATDNKSFSLQELAAFKKALSQMESSIRKLTN